MVWVWVGGVWEVGVGVGFGLSVLAEIGLEILALSETVYVGFF